MTLTIASTTPLRSTRSTSYADVLSAVAAVDGPLTDDELDAVLGPVTRPVPSTS